MVFQKCHNLNMKTPPKKKRKKKNTNGKLGMNMAIY